MLECGVKYGDGYGGEEHDDGVEEEEQEEEDDEGDDHVKLRIMMTKGMRKSARCAIMMSGPFEEKPSAVVVIIVSTVVLLYNVSVSALFSCCSTVYRARAGHQESPAEVASL